MDPMSLLSSLMRRSTQGELTILEIDLDFSVRSAPPENPLAVLRSVNAPTMRSLREGLREAAGDDTVLGLILHIGTCPLTATQCDELGAALDAFGRYKPVWAYAESFGELGSALMPYVLASHASKVWLQPSGQLGIGGVRAQITLLRGLLDKVGVEPEFGQRQEYKSAAETYVRRDISEANREMVQRLADSITEHAVEVVARRRGLTPEQVREAVAAGPLRPDEARHRGLIDHVGYRDEVYATARATWSPTATSRLRYVHRYTRNGALDLVAGRGKPAIAQVDVRGGIIDGRPQRGQSGRPVAAAEIVCQQLRAAGRDPLVKAVLLRVDSPGGSYIASDAIRREVQQLRSGGRPVVVSMGDVAASGGYFVAMAANEIVANPTTLTGSIGVLAGKFVTTELKAKIGLVMADILSAPWAGFQSPNAKFTAEQWAALDRRLDDIYADFTTKAAADRGMDLAAFEPLARGRVWTGSDARARGLVDHLGGMDLAIDRACALAGLERAESTLRPVAPLGFLTQFKPAESSDTLTGAVRAGTTPTLDDLVADVAARLGLDLPGVLSVPFHIELH